MSDALKPNPFTTAAVAGIVTQIALSSTFEVPTVKFLAFSGISDAVLLGYLIATAYAASSNTNLLHVALHFLRLNVIFFSTLTIATAIRRLFFHPLRNFPGKKVQALSALYQARITLKGQSSLGVLKQHRELGDFVRTGPNELSINNVEALKLQSRQPYISRGPFYNFGKLLSNGDPTCFNILTIRDNDIHRGWRGIWDLAFKTNALNEYNPRVEYHVGKFLETLLATNGEEINCTPLIQTFTFDVMADLGFGRDTGGQGLAGKYMAAISQYTVVVIIAGIMRNIADIAPYLPKGKNPKAAEFKQGTDEMLDARLELGTERKDIFTHLLVGDKETGTKFTRGQLDANARLVIIAGTDTTSTAITSIFRALAVHPEIQKKLYEEIKEAYSNVEEFDCNNTKTLPYLQAVIHEGLRFWNPAPLGVQSLTGPEGATIAGTYIPPRTAVRVPHLSLMTDERYFPDGEKFWPERWTEDRSTGVKDIRAYVPFS